MTVQRIMLATAVVALVALVAGSSTAIVAQEESEDSGTCCFTHPLYTGTCSVQPAEEETCADILAYLNNPMAQGKDYCGGTSIREGWVQVECEEEEP